MWPDRGGGTSTDLPASVQTGRVVFQSQSGEACCVAIDGTILSGGNSGLAVLDDLPTGPATVTVAGFNTDFAPAVPGITATCKTSPASVGRPCDPTQVASPAYSSPPLSVVILSGTRTNLGDVPMQSLPFVLDYSPAQDEVVTSPVNFAFTVVDALTNIRQQSVSLDVTFNDPAEPSAFRPITKRIPLTFDACADGSEQPCSPSGDLSLAGLKAAGTAPELPVGAVEAHIAGENLDNPPQTLDFRYTFDVLATATATETPVVPTPTTAAAAPVAAVDSSAGAVSDRSAQYVAPSPTPTFTPRTMP